MASIVPSTRLSLLRAEIYRAQGKYEEAAALFQRALAILERAFGPDSPGLTSNVQSLARIDVRPGKVRGGGGTVRATARDPRGKSPKQSN